MIGLEAVTARFAALPAAMKLAVETRLASEAAELVAAMKRAAPVGVAPEPHPGALRDSIHATRSPKRPVAYTITADARDAAGRPYGAWVEFGHAAPGGKHVPAHPFFWPTYHAHRRLLRSRLSRAGKAAAKQVWE